MISVCVAALNEEANIRDTLMTLDQASKRSGGTVLQIIVMNDGSTDQTASVVRAMMAENPTIELVTNEKNMGLGFSVRRALTFAKYSKFITVPGDNDMSADLLTAIFANADRADLVMAYFLNKEVRGIARNILSVTYASIYMITFGIFVQYINGPCVYPTDQLRKIELKSNRFSIAVESTIKLLRSGATYYEVSGYMQKGLAGSSSLSFRNFVEVVVSYLRLIYEVKIAGRSVYNKFPTRVH
jgi:glycosyltransferase involved in cell wall biosynthesis